MNKSTGGVASEESSGSYFSSYIEPATVVTLTIGALYIIGWSYADGYFARIGIYHGLLDLPTSYYLMQGYWAFAVTWIIFASFYLGIKKQPKNKIDAFYSNLVIAPIVPFLFAVAFYINARLQFWILLVFSALLLIIAIGLSCYQKSIIYMLRQLSLITQVFIFIFLFLFSGFIALELGAIRGINTIEGNSNDSTKIRFSWKGVPPPEIDNDELVLVLYRDGKYFVVKKEQPAPRLPNVYIIYDDQIEYAELTRITDRPFIHVR